MAKAARNNGNRMAATRFRPPLEMAFMFFSFFAGARKMQHFNQKRGFDVFSVAEEFRKSQRLRPAVIP
jgi:hypothetical protein